MAQDRGTASTSSATGCSPVRGLRREEAARYVGLSPTKFDQLVADGRMPKAIRIDGCVRWDIRRLDVAFDELIQEDQLNPWDTD